jgi:hypothetical protein
VNTGKTALASIMANSKSDKEYLDSVKKEISQGTLFPGGLVTDTADTNPLEGGSTPQPPPEEEPFTPSLGPGEEQGTLFRKDGSPRKWRTPKNATPTGQQPPPPPEQQELPLGKLDTRTGEEKKEAKRSAKEEESKRKELEKKQEAAAKRRSRVGSPNQKGFRFNNDGDLNKSDKDRFKFSSSEDMKGMSYDEFSRSIRSLMR